MILLKEMIGGQAVEVSRLNLVPVQYHLNELPRDILNLIYPCLRMADSLLFLSVVCKAFQKDSRLKEEFIRRVSIKRVVDLDYALFVLYADGRVYMKSRNCSSGEEQPFQKLSALSHEVVEEMIGHGNSVRFICKSGGVYSWKEQDYDDYNPLHEIVKEIIEVPNGVRIISKNGGESIITGGSSGAFSRWKKWYVDNHNPLKELKALSGKQDLKIVSSSNNFKVRFRVPEKIAKLQSSELSQYDSELYQPSDNCCSSFFSVSEVNLSFFHVYDDCIFMSKLPKFGPSGELVHDFRKIMSLNDRAVKDIAGQQDYFFLLIESDVWLWEPNGTDDMPRIILANKGIERIIKSGDCLFAIGDGTTYEIHGSDNEIPILLKALNGKHIRQIMSFHLYGEWSYYLIDDNGDVYVKGGNQCNQFGLANPEQMIDVPIKLEYLANKKLLNIKFLQNNPNDYRLHFICENTVFELRANGHTLEWTELEKMRDKGIREVSLFTSCRRDAFYSSKVNVTNHLFFSKEIYSQVNGKIKKDRNPYLLDLTHDLAEADASLSEFIYQRGQQFFDNQRPNLSSSSPFNVFGMVADYVATYRSSGIY